MYSFHPFDTTGRFRLPASFVPSSNLFSLFIIVGLLISSVACAQDDWRKSGELFNAMQMKADSWVADIGCREGYYTIRMAPIVLSGWVFAVDINAGALRNLHDNLRARHIENVTAVYSVEDNPMLPQGMLDAALIRNTYHEFSRPMSMLKHIRQALKKGGKLVVAETISGGLQNSGRDRQARSHEIAMRFVKSDLEKAGFRILKEVKRFTENRGDRHFWMLIATPDHF